MNRFICLGILFLSFNYPLFAQPFNKTIQQIDDLPFTASVLEVEYFYYHQPKDTLGLFKRKHNKNGDLVYQEVIQYATKKQPKTISKTYYDSAIGVFYESIYTPQLNKTVTLQRFKNENNQIEKAFKTIQKEGQIDTVFIHYKYITIENGREVLSSITHRLNGKTVEEELYTYKTKGSIQHSIFKKNGKITKQGLTVYKPNGEPLKTIYTIKPSNHKVHHLFDKNGILQKKEYYKTWQISADDVYEYNDNNEVISIKKSSYDITFEATILKYIPIPMTKE